MRTTADAAPGQRAVLHCVEPAAGRAPGTRRPRWRWWPWVVSGSGGRRGRWRWWGGAQGAGEVEAGGRKGSEGGWEGRGKDGEREAVGGIGGGGGDRGGAGSEWRPSGASERHHSRRRWGAGTAPSYARTRTRSKPAATTPAPSNGRGWRRRGPLCPGRRRSPVAASRGGSQSRAEGVGRSLITPAPMPLPPPPLTLHLQSTQPPLLPPPPHSP